MADFLLINAGNYAGNLVYPYAFVQVRALARRFGVSFASYDLHGLDDEARRNALQRMVQHHAPKMIGLHIRQADSIFLKDYLDLSPGTPGYFPLHAAQAVIRHLRTLTGAPVVVGGFGFTTYLEPVLRFLGADFGIAGEPDDLFARFAEALSGGHRELRNAVWLDDAGRCRAAERHWFAPLDEPEYDDDVLQEMEAFYSRATLHGEGQPTVAVELARGCPFACYFCSEPQVKGREPRVRDLDVVMHDVAFLAERGIRRFWLVCSELNIGSSALALAVAERFRALRRRFASRPPTWQAYHLPRWLTREDLQALYDSGFDGGWNDFPSLDDTNLVACRVPYRANDVAFHLDAKSRIHHFGPKGTPPYLSLFLGNAYATPATVSHTLRRLHQDGLAGRYPGAEVGLATRLFPFHLQGVFAPPPGVPQAFSIAPDGSRREVDITLPTFFHAPAIREHFDTEAEMHTFADYLGTTLMSRQYEQRRDWAGFVQRSMARAWFKRFVVQAQQQATADTPLPPPQALVESAAREPSSLFGEILAALGLKPLEASTPYNALLALLPHFDSRQALDDYLRRTLELEDDGREVWLLDHHLFRLNVNLQPRLRSFLL